MNEDVTTVSPTLGFIIKTIDFDGYLQFYFVLYLGNANFISRYRLNICEAA
jgi:hypothetical protein